MNPQTMTLDEVRDALSKLDGWEFEDSCDKRPVAFCPWYRQSTLGGLTWSQNPHPATLDGAAAALPKGWMLDKISHTLVWSAYATTNHAPYKRAVMDAPDELTARYRLALACRLAEKGATE